MLGYMLLKDPPPSRSEWLDDYFEMSDEAASTKRAESVNRQLALRTEEGAIVDFRVTFDEFSSFLKSASDTFSHIVNSSTPGRAPRHFQISFLAFYLLVIRDQKTLTKAPELARIINAHHRSLQIPEGGRWSAESRDTMIRAAKGAYESCFEDAGVIDPARTHWISRFENLLTQAKTEVSLYDFKQGFLRLDNNKSFDDKSFDKILATACGMANVKKGARGYILVGVAETKTTVDRLKTLYAIDSLRVNGFYVTGVNHEMVALGKTDDQFFQLIVDKINRSALSEDLRNYLARHIMPIVYAGKTVYVVEIEAQSKPSTFGGKFFDRRGNSLVEVPVDKLAEFITRYMGGF